MNRDFNLPVSCWSRKHMLGIHFPEEWHIDYLPMNGYGRMRIADYEIKKALREPIGTKPLRKIAEGKKEAVIVVDDMTRATRASQIASHIIREIKSAGISDDHIRFVMANGLHGAWYRDDFAKKIGEENVRKYPVYNHSPFTNCQEIGKTSKGTTVEINAEYMSCDLKVGIGSIVPHPMVGFGGGSKLILPGISSFDTIYHNHISVHSKNATFGAADMNSNWGFVEGNLTREDIEETGRIVGMDLKIDVLLNGFGESTSIFAGDLKKEFNSAIRYAQQEYSTRMMTKEFDVLVANTSAKANEATLAFSNWRHRMNKNRIMVIIAQAPEGQTTHYLYGKFGENQVGPGATIQYKDAGLKKLIVFSSYKTPDPLLPIVDPESIIWIRDWDEVVEEIASSFGHKPRVVILPNSEIQCDEETLKINQSNRQRAKNSCR